MAAVRTWDLAIAAFCALNVPLVLLIDSTAVLPRYVVPTPLHNLVQWHIRSTGDYLMRDKPPFFRGIVYAELFLQLPLHIVNAYAFFRGKAWGRTTGFLYGVHTATTMVPILFDIWCSRIPTKALLFSVYVPFLIIPLLVLARLYAYPLGAASGQASRKKRLD